MCQCSTSDCGCSDLLVPSGPRGLQGVPGITPALVFTATTLPAGSNATVSQSGGPATYDIVFGIPTGATGVGTPGADGADGADGVNAFTTTTAPFTMPADGTTVVIRLLETAWIGVGQWIYIEGAGYFIVQAVSNGVATILNPGVASGYPGGVNGNATPGTVIATGALTSPGGVPGLDGSSGTTGAAGVAAELLVTNTLPTTAPAAGRSSVIYTDSSTSPTFTVIYVWNGSSWSQRANIQGAAGTQIVNTPGDPNVTLPAGPIGTYAVRTDVPSMYVKTGSTTWSSVVSLTPTFTQVATQSAGNFGTVATYTQRVIGFEDDTVTIGAPGTYAFDLSYQSVSVSTDKDIELDWDDSTYAENAQWVWQVTNTDGAPINVTYAASQFNKKTGLTLPATLAAGATQVYHLVRQGARMLISDTYVSVAV